MPYTVISMATTRASLSLRLRFPILVSSRPSQPSDLPPPFCIEPLQRHSMDSGIFILAPYQTGSPSRRLTRRSKVQPATLFTPQDRNLSPEAHFPLQTVSGPDRAPFPRFINRFNSREILLVVDGSCINNGRHANKLQDPV